MNLRILSLLLLLSEGVVNFPGFAQIGYQPASAVSTKPVFKVDTAYPTTDKPQSKLWYMNGCWWAILPRKSGPSLWQRTASGWLENTEMSKALTGLPGRVDVWADANQITAVGVSSHSLTVFQLSLKIERNEIHWVPEVLATLNPPSPKDDIETATIVRDTKGRFWVASDAGDKICVWNSSENKKKWFGPNVLAEHIYADDISTVTILPDRQIGVIWSDQESDKVSIRVHKDGSPIEKWENEQVVQVGKKTADDHLHASLSPNGTLWVATKNSVDVLGLPQFVMRIRSKNGRWRNLPYAPLGQVRAPSRPVVISTENPAIVLAGHTIYNTKTPALGEIVFGIIDTADTVLLRNETTVIRPDTTGWEKGNRINDITVPKNPFQFNAPWIILASDREGNVYETDLKTMLKVQ